MARANHARCFKCGVKLPLYRKITDAEFCSTAHRQEFVDEQALLAMERLRETHRDCAPMTLAPGQYDAGKSSLQSADDFDFKGEFFELVDVPPAGDGNASPIPGSGTAHLPENVSHGDSVPAMGDAILWPLASRSTGTPDRVAVDPIAYELGCEPVVPSSPTRSLSLAVNFAGRTGIALRGRAPVSPAMLTLEGVRTPQPWIVASAMLPGSKLSLARIAGISTASETRMPALKPLNNTDTREHEPHRTPTSPRAWLPLPDARAESIRVAPAPQVSGLEALLLKAAQSSSTARTQLASAVDACQQRVQLPGLGSGSLTAGEIKSALQLTLKPLSLAVTLPALVHALPEPRSAIQAHREPCRPNARACNPLPVAPRFATMVHLSLGVARESATGWGVKNDPAAIAEFTPSPIKEPAFVAEAQVPLPSLAAKVPMQTGALRNQNRATRKSIMPPVDFTAAVRYPPLREEPRGTLGQFADAPVVPLSRGFVPAKLISGYFRNTPPSLRAMAVMVPILLLIAVRPNPEQVRAASPQVKEFVNTGLTNVKTMIQNRAGVEMIDDFNSGLDNWESRKDPGTSWSYDQTGFVKPGPLAIYRPSIGLSDYDFEFLGQIDKKALAWVFRAQDLQNYYAAKLVTLKAGPLPIIGLVRYAVVNGKEGPRKVSVLALPVHMDTLFRVRMQARGSDYSVYLQNRLVDFWSDDQLKSGGVGFFSAKGEQSRIRWVQVSHQYDTIGRLCAYFAPFAAVTYNMQPTMGAENK